MKRAGQLNDTQRAALDTLGRVRFATEAQLAHWCGVGVPAINKTLSKLLDAGLVTVENNARPAVWRLSHTGARITNCPLPSGRRQASWSVMAQACHANETEILLREQYPGFQFLARRRLLAQGFNPAHGEHAGSDAARVSALVLVDDHLMPSERLTRAWTRRHAPDPKLWPDPAGKRWADVMQRYLVACTDERHAQQHQRWIDSHGLPADVVVIKALWRS